MKIIKLGEVPSLKKYEAKCNNCKTEIEFIESESTRELSYKNESFLVVDCPVCRNKIYKEV